jgi:hypothetical protein
MTPFEEPTATAMVMRRPPREIPETKGEVRARRAETIDDTVAAFEILSAVFGERKETPAERRTRAEAERARSHRTLYVAELDGTIVAAAHAIDADGVVFLGGSATLPVARRRGAYLALVRARWDHAVKRGTPTLVIQAGKMSRPILERLGFETTAVIHVLVDDLRAR